LRAKATTVLLRELSSISVSRLTQAKVASNFDPGCIDSLRDFRIQTQHFAADRDEQVSKASKALDAATAARLVKANVASCQAKVEEILNGLTKLRKENDKSACHSPLA
jgi:hypothetical protein